MESNGTLLASCFRWSGNLCFIKSLLSSFNSIIDNSNKSATESTSIVSNLFDTSVSSATISSSQALTIAYKAFIKCKRIFCRLMSVEH